MKYFIGNWKMHLLPSASLKLACGLVKKVKRAPRGLKLALCPSFDSLEPVGKIIAKSAFALGAQDVFWEKRGAYTGEESVENLKELGCEYVIVGHSERRKLGETDQLVAQKLQAVAKAGMTPIFCVGETKEENDKGQKYEVLTRQLSVGLSNLQPTTYNLQPVLIAYEPVWAIGTGTPETPENARSSHKFIQKLLDKKFPKIRERAHIIYGGSVDSKNIVGFLKYPEIEGALVGGASTKLNELLLIIKKIGQFF